MIKDIKIVQDILGHTFADVDLLVRSFSHSSIAGEKKGDVKSHSLSNERLEFVGDRVLGLVIAHMVFETFPDEAEGAMARRHTALVRREALARVGNDLEFGRFMLMSKGEDDAGGRNNPALLANTMEAVIAALYLDGGLSAAEEFIRKYWKPLLDEDIIPPRDPKTALQEWAQARAMELPIYAEISREGPPHAPVFCIEVSLEGVEPARAAGQSKRTAERTAAEIMLKRLEAEN